MCVSVLVCLCSCLCVCSYVSSCSCVCANVCVCALACIWVGALRVEFSPVVLGLGSGRSMPTRVPYILIVAAVDAHAEFLTVVELGVEAGAGEVSVAVEQA